MTSVFSRIIAGELPGRFVYSDELSVVFLSIAPISLGHCLVVPREQIDQWTDAPVALLTHLTTVAQRIGAAVKLAFDAPRAGVIIAGFEVPHLHIHVYPARTLSDFDISQARTDVPATEMDDACTRVREALRQLGYDQHVPAQG